MIIQNLGTSSLHSPLKPQAHGHNRFDRADTFIWWGCCGGLMFCNFLLRSGQQARLL